jgi:hypothetical protein
MASHIMGNTFPVPFLSGVFLVASVLGWHVNLSPKLKYLEIMQMMSLSKDLNMHLSLLSVLASSVFTG